MTTSLGGKASLQNNPLQKINIVVTCTKRKRFHPDPGLQLRNIGAPNLRHAFVEWRNRLVEYSAKGISARELYAGDHWSVVQSLEEIASRTGLDATIWVCSTGYGLVGIDNHIKPYSATFSARHPDSVLRWRQSNEEKDPMALWWHLQEGWSGPESSQPRSISEVAEGDSESPMLVVASRDYLRAIGRDVGRAAKLLQNPDKLSIISTGTKSLPGLEANLVPSSAALQRRLGGSLHSLNVRLARYILAKCTEEEFYASTLAATVTQWLRVAPHYPRGNGKRMTDQEVQEFITGALAEDPEISWSSLLRRLRNSGHACKQERFASIFRATKENLMAQAEQSGAP